jgi:hypothetical protein
MIAAWSNAVAATESDSLLVMDLADAVANDSSPDAAVRWLWSMLDDGRGPWPTYDRYIHVIEALGGTWPVMRRACALFATPPSILARFVVERIPAAASQRIGVTWFSPCTTALVLAERAHDLAALFSAGLKPNGSKDPFALRRAAKHFIIASVIASDVASPELA